MMLCNILRRVNWGGEWIEEEDGNEEGGNKEGGLRGRNFGGQNDVILIDNFYTYLKSLK